MFAPWATNDHNVYRVTGDVQNTGMDAAVQSWCAGCSFSSFQSFLLVLSLQLFIYPIHGKFIDTINELQYMDPLIVLYFQQTHFLNNRHISSLNMELHPSINMEALYLSPTNTSYHSMSHLCGLSSPPATQRPWHSHHSIQSSVSSLRSSSGTQETSLIMLGSSSSSTLSTPILQNQEK